MPIYILQLNNMQNQAESVTPLAWSRNKQVLRDFMARERVEPWIHRTELFGENKRYSKTFRQGGPLEWFNAPHPDDTTFMDTPCFLEVEDREEYVASAGERWDHWVGQLPEVTS